MERLYLGVFRPSNSRTKGEGSFHYQRKRRRHFCRVARDSGEMQTRESLRQSLSLLRKALSPRHAHALFTRGGTVEFLEGASEFEGWRLSVRQQLNEKTIDALNELLCHDDSEDDFHRFVVVHHSPTQRKSPQNGYVARSQGQQAPYAKHRDLSPTNLDCLSFFESTLFVAVQTLHAVTIGRRFIQASHSGTHDVKNVGQIPLALASAFLAAEVPLAGRLGDGVLNGADAHASLGGADPWRSASAAIPA
jgi:hypothetical protein